jgi:hypothetical protein
VKFDWPVSARSTMTTVLGGSIDSSLHFCFTKKEACQPDLSPSDQHAVTSALYILAYFVTGMLINNCSDSSVMISISSSIVLGEVFFKVS